MSARKLVNTLLFMLGAYLFLFAACQVESAQAADDIVWQSMTTKYTRIRYQTREDLKKFDQKINYYPLQSDLKWISKLEKVNNLNDRIKLKIDAMYERVQQILDMRKKTAKLKINIYADKNQLESSLEKIFKKKISYKAWYIYEFKTLYVNADLLHEGMLAHEMGHHIIDHFFRVRPPGATAEILARYVDNHLYQRSRTSGNFKLIIK